MSQDLHEHNDQNIDCERVQPSNQPQGSELSEHATLAQPGKHRGAKEKFKASFFDEEHWNAYQRVSKHLSDRDGSLIAKKKFLETHPSNQNDREEEWQAEIYDIKNLLFIHGHDETARSRAVLLRNRLGLEKDDSALARRVRTQCNEVLRDARGKGFGEAHSLAMRVIDAWEEQGEWLRVAVAWLALGDLYRYYADTVLDINGTFFREALQSFRRARDFALVLGIKQNRNDAMLIAFEAARYELRTITECGDQPRSEAAVKLALIIRDHAERLGSPAVMAEYFKEETIYRVYCGEPDVAEASLCKLQILGIPDNSSRTVLRFLRPRVDLLLAQGDKRQAQERSDEFFARRREYPADNHYRAWQVWRQGGISLPPDVGSISTTRSLPLFFSLLHWEGSLLLV